ncbi:MurR/RpiR family transcriptional regulator [Tropicimonas marinistellae]|uniref:MurR/RpiR family transcriptional regulator n=1 Tax=Tropicimonas marinistellae TaxID=1739787 RepID=UPI00082B11D9|nr:MurR/RpiR family transcriptional regulator [Tropicimonas marinistellae]
MSDEHEETLDRLRQRLGTVASDASPQVAALARWAMDHPQELAFHSVRGLANRATVNANTVVRLAQALGFKGFEQCRAVFQAALRDSVPSYGRRAANLRTNGADNLTTRIRDSAVANTQALYSDDMIARMDRAVTLLLAARAIHCIGVRSCFPVAQYLTYTGRMAFETFVPPQADPGGVLDSIVDCGPQDVVILVTYSHYSSEVLRAHAVALRTRARLIALTDSHAAPVAKGAEITFCLPMDGPQPLPSLGMYFLLAETLVAEMTARSDGASDRIAQRESRRLAGGAYRGAE